jgi:uncharacterized protein (TIGR02246 family)
MARCFPQDGVHARRGSLNRIVRRNDAVPPTGSIRAILLLALALGCGLGLAKAADSRDAITDTVLTCVRGISTGDVALIASTFAEDATAFFPSRAHARLSGRAAIAEAFAELFGPNPRTTTITPRDIVIQEFGEIAIVTAHLKDPPALPIREASTFPRRTFVLRRDGERWLIVHLHASNFPLVPAAGAPGGAK